MQFFSNVEDNRNKINSNDSESNIEDIENGCINLFAKESKHDFLKILKINNPEVQSTSASKKKNKKTVLWKTVTQIDFIDNLI